MALPVAQYWCLLDQFGLIFTLYVPRQMVKWSIRMVKCKSGHRTFTTTDYF
ncbi:hypothetical protein T08_16425 [Trichinella sp. T8]|nr:hypothetical protein T08_16425 [Trichinella sp. T8]